MDYAKILESLRGLIKEDSSPEQVEQITSIVKDIESAKTENDDLIIKHEELRQKYILALTQSTFKDNGTPTLSSTFSTSILSIIITTILSLVKINKS